MKSLFLSASLLFLIGCGGSGSSNNINTGNNGQNYNLRNIYKTNYSFNAPMSSTASNDKFEFLMSTTIQSKTILNNKTVTPIVTIASLTNKTTGASDSFNSTSYYDINGIKIQTENSDTGVICTLANNPSPLPTNAQVGDSGTGSYLDCSDGTAYKETWTLISRNGKVWLQENSKIYDVSGSVSTTEKFQMQIDTNGNISKITTQIYYVPNDVTITMPETRVSSR